MTTRFDCTPCPYCHQPSFFFIEDPILIKKIMAWAANPAIDIQVALPELSADQREQMMTGFHRACWETIFADMEEE